MREKNLIFKAPENIKANVVRMGLAFIFGVAALTYLVFKVIVPEIESGRLYEEYRWVGAIFAVLVFVYGLKVILSNWVSFWIDSIVVEIGSDYITGQNMWDKPKKIKIDEIIEIRCKPGFYSMVLIDKNKHKFIVSGAVDFFGDCMEEVVRRAKNVEKIDFKGVDKNPMYWRKKSPFDNMGNSQ